MLKRILGTLAGIVVAMLVVMAMDMLSHALFPESVAKSMDMAAIATALAAAPLAAKAIMAAGWFLATLIGGLVALRLSGWTPAAWIVAGLILAACLYNGFAIPGVPLWMQVAGVVGPLLGGWLATRFGARGA
jgi:hypothetical protein